MLQNLEYFYKKTIAFFVLVGYTKDVELSFAPVMFGGFMIDRVFKKVLDGLKYIA